MQHNKNKQMSGLAINGGQPVHKKPWRTGPYHFRDELDVLEKVLAGPALPLARGKWVMAYREQLQNFYNMKYAVPASSGSAAIHVGLAAMAIGAGDEVIVSPLTDYGSIIGILQLNAIPVFADVQRDGVLLDLDAVAAKITPYTKAIMPVHNAGYMVDMPALMKLARRHGLLVLEDCAQAHLAAIKGKYAGTFGHIGVWSTNESKHMKSGEGGFLLSNNRRMAEYADLFADKCYDRFRGAPATPAFPAINARMSDVNAAIAGVQFKRLPGWIAKRQAFGNTMTEEIQGIPGVKPHPQPRHAQPSYWWVMLVVDESVLGVNAGRFAEILCAEGIPSGGMRPSILDWEVFRRLHDNPRAFNGYVPGRLKKGAFPEHEYPNARAVRERVFTVRVSQHNTVAEARAAARAVRKVAGALLEGTT